MQCYMKPAHKGKDLHYDKRKRTISIQFANINVRYVLKPLGEVGRLQTVPDYCTEGCEGKLKGMGTVAQQLEKHSRCF